MTRLEIPESELRTLIDVRGLSMTQAARLLGVATTTVRRRYRVLQGLSERPDRIGRPTCRLSAQAFDARPSPTPGIPFGDWIEDKAAALTKDKGREAGV